MLDTVSLRSYFGLNRRKLQATPFSLSEMDGELTSPSQGNGVHTDAIKTFAIAKCMKSGWLAHWFDDTAEMRGFRDTIASAKMAPLRRRHSSSVYSQSD